MQFVCVDARFKFFDGNNVFTVEYTYGIQTWFVFKDQESTGALWSKKIDPKKQKSPNRIEAESILGDYLETVPA